MATVQVLKVTHRVEGRVKTVGEGVKRVEDKVMDVDNRINLAIEGTFSTLATRTYLHKSAHD